VDLDVFSDGDAGHRNGMMMELDPAISVDGPGFPKAKDIFRVGVGRGKGERPEERFSGPQRRLETDMRDLAGGGMNTLMVIPDDLLLQDLAQVGDRGQFFPGGRADDSILEPTIGAFDFPLGLRREGIDDINAEEAEGLLPLGIDVVRLKNGLVPGAVTGVDIAENPEGIDIILQGQAVATGEGFGRLKMSPGGLMFEKVGEKELPAVIVEGGDQRPLALGIRRPAMKRGVVLDESADGGGDDLPIVSLLFRTGPVTSERFGSIDDRGQRDIDPTVPKSITDGRIVEGGDGERGIFDQSAFLEKKRSDNFLTTFSHPAWRVSMVGNGKMAGIFPKELPEGEEAGLPDPQNLLDLGAIDLPIFVRSEQAPQLVVGESLVNLSHSVLLVEDCSSGVHFSALISSLFSFPQHKFY